MRTSPDAPPPDLHDDVGVPHLFGPDTPRRERRRRRSADPVTALNLQLAETRREHDLTAIVLVDDRGSLLAGAGAFPVCEELAAYAPLLASPSAVAREAVRACIDALSAEIAVHPFRLDGAPVLLCARGGAGARTTPFEALAGGCRRILGAA